MVFLRSFAIALILRHLVWPSQSGLRKSQGKQKPTGKPRRLTGGLVLAGTTLLRVDSRIVYDK